MAKYTIKRNDFDQFYVYEKTRHHTGVRWITLENIVDEFPTSESAKQKYPKAQIVDLGEEWFDRLSMSQNQPSNME
tara:strand:+ start:76 stop:303 length:228 start_codon:yes stop_codon:yes gene_type:complete